MTNYDMMKNVASNLMAFLDEKGISINFSKSGFRKLKKKSWCERKLKQFGYSLVYQIDTDYGVVMVLEDCYFATFAEEHDSIFCRWAWDLEMEMDDVLNILEPYFSPDCDYVAFTSFYDVKKVFS